MWKSFLYELHELTLLLDAGADRLLKEKFGIRYATFLLLSVIDCEGPRVSQVHIAEALCLTPPALTKQIPKLVELWWLEIAPNPQDRRETLISLTSEGTTLMRKIQKLLEDGFSKGIASITTHSELEHTRLILEKIRTHITIS